MRKYILVFFLVASILACKENKKENNNLNNKQIEKTKKVFSFMFEAIIENDGIFTLYFLEEGQKKINSTNSVVLDVRGSEESQIVLFTIKEEIIPDKLFLRFVNDEKKQTIDIKTTTLSYGEKSIVIQDSLFFQFFMPNKFVEYDNETSRATTKEVNGEYLPRFRSREVLIEKLWTEF